MRIGVVGAGRMGLLRARLLSEHPEVSHVYVGNRSRERGRVAVAESGIAAEAVSIDELFDQDVDAFVIATATSAHAELLRRCLDQRKPVLCEKPIAQSLAETLELTRAFAHAQAPLQIGFMRRFDAGFRAARAAILDGAVGTVYCIRIVSHDHEVGSPEFIEGSGGIFQDLCVHDFDIVRWATGDEFLRVSAYGAVREHDHYGERGDFDTCLVSAELTSGILVSISGCRHDPRGYDFRLEVFGSRDSIAVGLCARTPLNTLDQPSLLAGLVYRGFGDRFADAFVQETNTFVELAQGRVGNPAPPEDAVAAYRVALAAERSAREGRVTDMTEREATTPA
jgi:myo-inositol 2-dehydrogenase / D-chiro-inositol 1-dehydrogenase